LGNWGFVQIIAAKDLKAKGTGGSSNPFCTVEYMDEVYETSVVESSLNPYWDEHVTVFASFFSFLSFLFWDLMFNLNDNLIEYSSKIRDPSKKIKISVWHKDPNSEKSVLKMLKEEPNDFLGRVVLQIDELFDFGNFTDKWFELQKRSNRSNISGSIRIQFDLNVSFFLVYLIWRE